MASIMSSRAICAAYKDGAIEMDGRMWLYAGPGYLLAVSGVKPLKNLRQSMELLVATHYRSIRILLITNSFVQAFERRS